MNRRRRPSAAWAARKISELHRLAAELEAPGPGNIWRHARDRERTARELRAQAAGLYRFLPDPVLSAELPF
jgi:hypothetical protein